jgi:hypothetical protein
MIRLGILLVVVCFKVSAFLLDLRSAASSLRYAINRPELLAVLQRELASLEAVVVESESSLRWKELSTVSRCVAALQELELDLAMLQEHFEGTDEKLKETALYFSKEFEQCQLEIEGQLNSILEEESRRSPSG